MSPDHSVSMTRRRDYVVRLEDGELIKEDIRAKNAGMPVCEYGEVYHCACGERFRDEQKVIEHIKETVSGPTATSVSDEDDTDDSKDWTHQDEFVCSECETVDTFISNDKIICKDCRSVICDTCPECDSTMLVTDSDRDELICSDCGFVISEGEGATEDLEWRAYAETNNRKRKRVGESHARFDDHPVSSDSDNDTKQQESDEPSDLPDNCIDCDSQDIESVPDNSEQSIHALKSEDRKVTFLSVEAKNDDTAIHNAHTRAMGDWEDATIIHTIERENSLTTVYVVMLSAELPRMDLPLEI